MHDVIHNEQFLMAVTLLSLTLYIKKGEIFVVIMHSFILYIAILTFIWLLIAYAFL